MANKRVLIDNNPGRNAQTYGIARELGTEMELIHEPSVGVIGNKGDSQCYLGVQQKVEKIHFVHRCAHFCEMSIFAQSEITRPFLKIKA